ncbi:MAG TPA: hypothetical protein DEB06_08740 [Phycisphaerales bacterium]|nr:hypothetical protein [Phycisphaerales bacterium]
MSLDGWTVDAGSLRLRGWVEPGEGLARVTLRATLLDAPAHPEPAAFIAEDSDSPGVTATALRLSFDIRLRLSREASVIANESAVEFSRLSDDGAVIDRAAFLLKDDRALATDPLLPPAPLRLRVHGSHEAPGFRDTGWRCARDIRAAAERFAPIGSFARVLDWGCGCGRLSRFLSRWIAPDRLLGCDIDREAIDWMRRAYPRQDFRVISPSPPSPYDDASFDLIVGVSIFTHLDERFELLWLDELRRLLRPGGLAIVSVHGPSACPPHLGPALAAGGRVDEPSVGAHFFEPYTGKDYYRTTFVTEHFVRSRWTRGLGIAAYLERALAKHHDLVVLRSPASS